MIDRLTTHLGFRGTWLVLLGLIWVTFGVGMLVGDPETVRPYVLHHLLDYQIRAGFWIATGLIAVAVGLAGDRRNDWPGHVALWVMPTLRLLSFGVSWLIWLLTGLIDEPVGNPLGWYSLLIWGAIVAMLRVVAGWPNPSPRPPAPPSREHA